MTPTIQSAKGTRIQGTAGGSQTVKCRGRIQAVHESTSGVDGRNSNRQSPRIKYDCNLLCGLRIDACLSQWVEYSSYQSLVTNAPCLKHLYQPLLALTLYRKRSRYATSRASEIKSRRILALCASQKVISDWLRSAHKSSHSLNQCDERLAFFHDICGQLCPVVAADVRRHMRRPGWNEQDIAGIHS